MSLLFTPLLGYFTFFVVMFIAFNLGMLMLVPLLLLAAWFQDSDRIGVTCADGRSVVCFGSANCYLA